MTKILIDGDTFDVPEDEDWTLGELAEFSRLRDKWGEMGATIAVVWIVKHRQDPSFTIEDAEQVKAGGIEDVEEEAVPLGGSSDGSSGNGSSSSGPSETLADSGLLPLEGTTV